MSKGGGEKPTIAILADARFVATFKTQKSTLLPW